MRNLPSILVALTLMILVPNVYSRMITVGHAVEYDYHTITEAAQAAQPDDVILVAEGTYSEDTGETFPIDVGSSITLKRAVFASQPVIRGCVRIDGDGIRLDGFEITECSGRGIWIKDNSKVEVVNCVIMENQGGGVYCGSNSEASFSNCTISSNKAKDGAGVYAPGYDAPSRLGFYHCLITNNLATDETWPDYDKNSAGGAVYLRGEGEFVNCLIAHNRVSNVAIPHFWLGGYAYSYGGGIYTHERAICHNCSFTDNTVYAGIYGHGYGTASAAGGAIFGSADLMNCIVDTSLDGSFSIRYSDITGDIIGSWEGEGNIDVDPGFVGPPYVNYHLLGSSPCVDAGDPDSQWNDVCLPPGKGSSRNDIGAYGGPCNCGWGEPTWPPVCFDFDRSHSGWAFWGKVFGFDVPRDKWETGHLGLSPAESANCFSYWGSPVVYVQKDKRYRIRYTLSSDVSNADEALDFRLRANELGNWRYWTAAVISLNDAAPTTQMKTYDLIVMPETESPTDSLALSFDLMGFDPQNDLQSWLYLDEIHIDEVNIAPSTPEVIVAHYTFDGVPDGWEFQGKIGDFDEPRHIILINRLGLSPYHSSYCFSYWLSPEIEIQKDKVYLVRWQVSSGVSDPDQVVDFRLRCNQTSNQRTWDTGTLFSLGDAYPTGMEPKTYELIISPQMSTPSDTIRLSFDIMSFDASNDLSSYIYLEDVTVQEYLILP